MKQHGSWEPPETIPGHFLEEIFDLFLGEWHFSLCFVESGGKGHAAVRHCAPAAPWQQPSQELLAAPG